MANKNFLIGYGERLTEKIAAPPSQMHKNHPYTFEASQRRLLPQINGVAEQLTLLPESVFPNNQAVTSIVLHPAYVAKSYYPEALLRELNLKAVGSRAKEVSPERWTKKEHPDSVMTTELFVSTSRENFSTITRKIAEWEGGMPAANDLAKVETIQFVDPREKIKQIRSTTEDVLLEVILHATAQNASNFILEGFKKYLETLETEIDLDRRLYVEGLCFLPLHAKRNKVDEIAKYSFLRLVREMPQLRRITRTATNHSFNVTLPDKDPIDPSLRVAILDGGLPDNHGLDRWVDKHDAPHLSRSLADFTNHGMQVTSAYLFGHIQRGEPLKAPYAYVDHFRVVDYKDYNRGPTDLYHVLTRIKDILKTRNYGFVIMCLAPELPIDDDPVDAWTSVLDEIFSRGTILPMIAAGNGGQNDRDSGNARIQVPADCVNALTIGSANSPGDNWARAEYSSVGPGRAPGVVKPDVLAFGGSRREPFYVLNLDNSGKTVGTAGTSISTPFAMRTATAIRAHYGSVLTPIALKALLVNSAEPSKHHKHDVGWGRVPLNIDDILLTYDHTARIVYQGTLSPAEWVNAPIPVPEEAMNGLVTIEATICFFSATDPQDSVNYTRSGLEIRFRPNEDVRSDPEQVYADTKSFFSAKSLYESTDGLRDDAHKWETTLSASKRMRGTGLKNPSFNIHYNARAAGNATDGAVDIPYALVVTVRSPKTANLYNKIVTRYRTTLEVLTPAIEIPITT